MGSWGPVREFISRVSCLKCDSCDWNLLNDTFFRMVYIFILLMAAAASAQSILFIDLNNAPSEIKAVASGRHVDVVPTYLTIDRQTRQQVEAIHRKNEQSQRLSSRCYVDGNMDDCLLLEKMFGISSQSQYYDFLHRLGSERRQLWPEFKAASLENEILSVARSGYETVVISGHHSNGYMSGELVDAFQFDVLRDIVARNPNIFSRVKYLVILGCNSGQKNIITRWHNVFPSSHLVVASAGIAPIKTDVRNLEFIKKLMSQIDGLVRKNNQNEVLNVSEFLGQIRTSGWPAAVLYKNKNFNYEYKTN